MHLAHTRSTGSLGQLTKLGWGNFHLVQFLNFAGAFGNFWLCAVEHVALCAGGDRIPSLQHRVPGCRVWWNPRTFSGLLFHGPLGWFGRCGQDTWKTIETVMISLGQCSLICVFKTFTSCLPYNCLQDWHNIYSVYVLRVVHVWWIWRRKQANYIRNYTSLINVSSQQFKLIISQWLQLVFPGIMNPNITKKCLVFWWFLQTDGIIDISRTPTPSSWPPG